LIGLKMLTDEEWSVLEKYSFIDEQTRE